MTVLKILLSTTHELKGKLKEKVEEHKELALISKKLAVIKTDVPVEFHEEDFRLSEPNKEAIVELFDELEFKTLTQRLFGKDNKTSSDAPKRVKSDSQQTSLFDSINDEENMEEELTNSKITVRNINNTKYNYHLVDTKEKRTSLLKYLMLQNEFCFDTETTSVNAYEAEIIGISFCYYSGEAFYVPLLEDDKKEVLAEFKELFENEQSIKIAQNIKYDVHILKNYGIDVKGKYFDTMIAHYLIYPEEKHGMDFLAKKYLNYEPISIETLIGKKGKNQGLMSDANLDEVCVYACEDADITFQLKSIIAKELKENNLSELYNQIEEPLIPALVEMERNGVSLDIDFLKNYSSELAEESTETENKIYEIAGEKFNIASPKQTRGNFI